MAGPGTGSGGPRDSLALPRLPACQREGGREALGPVLHHAALGLVRVWVLEAQPLLGPVLLQVGELFAVDGSTALPGQGSGTEER